MKNLGIWVRAARPRTLPLALSSTTLGSLLAAADGPFSWSVCILASVTTLLLQILANLANDYGDFMNGKDTAERIGPQRMMQSGQISPQNMVRALCVLVLATLVAGTALILAGTSGIGLDSAAYLVMGIAAVVAAVKYTIGKHPYGYRGWGDVSVFIFFGLVGTLGTYYLHTHRLRADVFLPASSIGLLSAGVLNLNNMRDEQTDRRANIRTLVIIMGRPIARIYHLSLVVTAVIAGLAYTFLNYQSVYQFLFLLLLPPLYLDVAAVFRTTRSVDLVAELQRLSLSTLLFAIGLGVGVLISS